MSFIGVLESVGKGFEKGLQWALTYAIPAEKLVGLLFPEALPAVTAAVDATTLIQNAVLLVEQKFAASGTQSSTGTQKLAEVVLLTQGAVTSLLEKAGVTVNASYLENLVTAVVSILNVQQMPSNAATAATAAAS
jgi:hypothetical protein